MSTGISRPHALAMKDAEAFRALFDGCYERWEIAGSLRRRKPEVSDAEHVVIPRIAQERGDGLFGETVAVNLMLRRMDELVTSAEISRHIYGATGFRWGDKYRGCDFRGYMHEVFCADEIGFGSTFAIRTGSADFSRRLVTGLLRAGYRNDKGKVWRCVRCQACEARGMSKDCKECDGTALKTVEIVPVPTEEEFFRLAGIRLIPAEQRV